MRITCPSCASEYEVPDSLAAGRAVRCARCSTKWHPVPDPAVASSAILEPEPDLPPEPLPEPPYSAPIPAPLAATEPLLAAPPQPAQRPLPLLLAWAGSALLIILLVAAAIAWRAPIMHGWPPSTRLYAALGLQ